MGREPSHCALHLPGLLGRAAGSRAPGMPKYRERRAGARRERRLASEQALLCDSVSIICCQMGILVVWILPVAVVSSWRCCQFGTRITLCPPGLTLLQISAPVTHSASSFFM